MSSVSRWVVATLAVGVVIALGVLSTAGARKRQRPPACPPGRYLLAEPLVTNGSPLGAVVDASESFVSIDDVCEPVAPKKYRGARKGTKVKAKWSGCTGLDGKVRLKGKIVDDCARLAGKLRAKKFKRRVEALRSVCGDGIVDVGAGEECDPPTAGACSAACRQTVSAVVGAGGGQLTSLDGRLSLMIPAGALGGDTEITVRRLEPEELPAGALELGFDTAYRLGPEGLQFAGPVTVALLQDAPARDQDGGLRADVGLLFMLSGAEIELLAAQRTRIDGASNVVTTSGELTHFSDLYPFKSRGRTTDDEPEPLAEASVSIAPTPPIPVGASFLSTVLFVLTNRDLSGLTDVFHTNRTDADVVRYRGELSSSATPDAESCDSMPLDTDETVKIGEVQQSGKDGQMPDSADGFLCYRCLRVGEQAVTGEITVSVPNPCDEDLLGNVGNTLFEALCALLGSATDDELTVEYEEPVACVDPSATTTTVTPTTSTTSSMTSTTGPPTSTSTSTSSTTSSSTTTTLDGPACGTTLSPECAGACPPGQFCVPLRDFLGSDFCACTAGGCGNDECGDCIGVDVVCEANGPPSDCTGARCVPFVPVSTTTSTSGSSTTSSSTTSSTSTSTTTTLLPCGLDDSQSPRMCVGNCPPGLVCLAVGLAENPGCECVVPSFACENDARCAGLCPSPDQACVELPNLDCVCATTTTSTSSTTSSSTTTSTSSTTSTTLMAGGCASLDGTACGGECPDGQVCRALESRTGGGCLCVPADSACPEGQPPNPSLGFCGGLCPREDQACADDESGTCVCATCRLFEVDGTPVCFGGCANQFETCAAVGGDCACVPNNDFCQPQDGGTCGGRCSSPLEACVVSGPGCVCSMQP